MEHGYLCSCAACNYERVMHTVREKYSMHEATAEDPFPPKKEFYHCNLCDNYHPAGYSHTVTDRMRYNKPPYTQQRRQSKHPGKYQRIYNNAMDMFEWQYKPWPSAEWVTYYKVSAEMLAKEVKSYGVKIVSKKFHTAASQALNEERFYKVERVDTSA